MRKIILPLLMLLFVNGMAKEMFCSVDKSIMEIIAFTEKHNKKEAGYEYLISFNNKRDGKLIKKQLGKDIFLDNRTIDCRNQKLCVQITKYLVNKQHIKNLDLGAYQINYKYHKMPFSNYFSFKKSYLKACSIVSNLIKKHGYSWRTIAMYHSATPRYNYAYLKKISTILGE